MWEMLQKGGIISGIVGAIIGMIFARITRLLDERPALEWFDTPTADEQLLAHGDLTVRNGGSRSLLVERLSVKQAGLVLHLWRGLHVDPADGPSVEVGEMLAPHGQVPSSCTLNLSVTRPPGGTSKGGSKRSSLPRTCTVVVHGRWTTALPLLPFWKRAVRRRLWLAIGPTRLAR